jgi:hypothetical protein
MTYASAEERRSLIAGLRDLAGFLEENPEVPAPRWADLLVFPPHTTDQEMKTEIDTIAALIGAEVTDGTADDGHYTTARAFGAVQYRAVGIPGQLRPHRSTQMPEAESIILPETGEKV